MSKIRRLYGLSNFITYQTDESSQPKGVMSLARVDHLNTVQNHQLGLRTDYTNQVPVPPVACQFHVKAQWGDPYTDVWASSAIPTFGYHMALKELVIFFWIKVKR